MKSETANFLSVHKNDPVDGMFDTPLSRISSELRAAIIRDPIVVSPDTSVLDAVVLMSQWRSSCSTPLSEANSQNAQVGEARSSCVCVVKDGQLIGILTERDVVRLSADEQSLESIKIQDVMTTSVITLQESEFNHLHIAARRFKEDGIRHLPIVNQSHQLTGLLTHATLQRALQPVHLLKLRTVEEVMVRHVVCASPSTSLLTIAQMMASHQISCVVIIDTNSDDTLTSPKIPLGILTERDIVQFRMLGVNLAICQAQNCMSSPVFTVNCQDSLWSVKHQFLKTLISRLVVIGSQGEMLGLITQTSLLQVLNSLELYHLNDLLEQRIQTLEEEKIELLKTRSTHLELKVRERTLALAAKAKREKLVSSIAAQILSSLSLQEILETTVEEVRQLLDCHRVNIWQFQSNGSAIAVADSISDAIPSLIGHEVSAPDVSSAYLNDYKQGKITVIKDTEETYLSSCHRLFLSQNQVRAKVVVPIMSVGNLWGLLHSSEQDVRRDWQSEDIALLKELAVHLGIAIQQATAFAQVQAQVQEHQITEARLRASEHRYATLASAAPVGIFRTDCLGNYLYVNEHWSRMTGLTQAEALGQGWQESLHPLDLPLLKSEWEHAIAGDSQFQLEYRIQQKNGVFAWVYGQVVAQKNEDGQVYGYIGSIIDITDRKYAEFTFNKVVEGTAAVAGEDFFPAMVKHIAEAFNVHYALVTQKVEDKLMPLAFWMKGKLVKAEEYPFRNTPCEVTLKDGQYFCESLVQQKFPQDIELVDLGVNSYFGIVLRSSKGEPIGSLCIMNNEPIQKTKRNNNLLRVFAARAAAELEQILANDALRQLNQSLETRVEQRTQELNEREAQLQDFFENANDLIQSVVLEDQHFEYVNRAWRETLGYSDAEIQNLNLFDVLHPDCHQKYQDSLQQFKESKIAQNQRLELTFLDKHQNPVLVEGSIDFRFDGDRPVAQRGIFRDITSRKQQENALKESQQFLQTVLDAFPLYVFWKNQESVFIGCNQNFAKSAGLNSPSEIVGKTDFDLPWGKTEAKLYREDDRQIIKSNQGKLGYIETQVLSTGEQVWVETNKIPLHNLEGGVIGVLGTYQDISDRKRAEEAIKQHSAAIEAAVDGIAILKDDQFLYLNQAYLSLLGYNNIDELIGKGWDALYPPKQANWFQFEVFPKLVRDRYWRGETIAQKKDGSTFAQELSLTLTEEELLICVCRDVTIRKENEAQLHLKNLELARATRLKDEFLANMSHELRTPLNAILGLSEALQEEAFGDITRPQGKALQTIERSGAHLLELINDILDLSKIEAGQVKLNVERSNVQTICLASLSFIKHQALKKKIYLQLDVARDLPHIMVDKRRLSQILINLLNNAVKFTPEEGTISLQVGMEMPSSVQDDRRFMRFTVSDTGIGISSANLSKLFQPFVQIDSSLNRKFSGTGLGLSLVKKLVELHDGHVTAVSEEGVGSTFTVALPCIEFDNIKSEGHDSFPIGDLGSKEPAQEPVALNSPLVLLAEDNEANIMTFSSYLKLKGYRLQIVKNGQEALDFVKQTKPDIILMDIQMPVMDGIQATQNIRLQSDCQDIPIIALTALAMPGDRERCLDAGVNEYLTKPVKLTQLASLIASILKPEKDP